MNKITINIHKTITHLGFCLGATGAAERRPLGATGSDEHRPLGAAGSDERRPLGAAGSDERRPPPHTIERQVL